MLVGGATRSMQKSQKSYEKMLETSAQVRSYKQSTVGRGLEEFVFLVDRAVVQGVERLTGHAAENKEPGIIYEGGGGQGKYSGGYMLFPCKLGVGRGSVS